MRVKTLIGLQPFEVIFFVEQKFIKFDLALKLSMRKFLEHVQSLFIMFSTLWKEFFLVVKSLMGTPVDWKIFTRNFFFQLRVRAHGGVQLKICFSTIKDLPKWFFSNNGIFLSQNSYGYKTHLYSFRAIFGLKLTKFDLTLEIIIRNRSKAPWKISMIFLTIWKKNFFVAKSHMGTLLEWFFLHKKKSVCVSGIFGRTNQKCFDLVRVHLKVASNWLYIA